MLPDVAKSLIFGLVLVALVVAIYRHRTVLGSGGNNGNVTTIVVDETSAYNFSGGFLVVVGPDGELVETAHALSGAAFNATRMWREEIEGVETDPLISLFERNFSAVILRQGPFRTLKLFDRYSPSSMADVLDFYEIEGDAGYLWNPAEVMEGDGWRAFHAYTLHDDAEAVTGFYTQAPAYSGWVMRSQMAREPAHFSLDSAYTEWHKSRTFRLASVMMAWHTPIPE